MHIVQITPGAGGMFCGNCFRDNALVAELRRQGHSTEMISLYLPMRLEDEDQSAGTPIFFSGINVYLQQKAPFMKKMPEWLHRAFESPGLLKLAAGKAAKTRPEDLGELTLSILRGEEGNQGRELEQLIDFLKNHGKADLISLSNALLVGMARRLKRELNIPVVCMLQGEDSFLDSLPDTFRDKAWETVSERARDIDLFIAPSNYFAELMTRRLKLPSDRVRVIYNGIDLTGYERATKAPNPPVLGFFARMCREKGIDTVVDAYIELRRRNRVPGLKLHIGGGMGLRDEIVVTEMKSRLNEAGVLNSVEFFPNLDKSAKQAFFKQLSVFCVPASYGEAFGLYLIEAWAAGVPAVQPPVAAFPELIKSSGGGLIANSLSPAALAEAIEGLLSNEDERLRMGARARHAVETTFSSANMTHQMVEAFSSIKINGLRI